MTQKTGYPSIDRPWEKYYTQEELSTPLPKMTLYQNIYCHNKDYPNDVAILYFGNAIKYGALFQMVDVCAMALKRCGVGRGDCVCLCTAGVPEAIVLVLACNKLGALANLLNPLFTSDQMIDRINDTDAKLLFVLDKVYGRVAEALGKTCVQQVVVMPVYSSMPQPMKLLASLQKKDIALTNAMKRPDHETWRGFLRGGKGASAEAYAALEAPYEKDTPAVMVYSSGTAGASKGIVLSNDAANAVIAHSSVTSHRHRRGNTFLQMIPVWFSTGIILSVMMPLSMGITVIPEPVFSKESFSRDLAKYRPNMTLGSTSLWRYAIHSKELQNVDFSQMTFPMSGGEAIRQQDGEDIKKFLKERGCNATFFVGYGMCELGSQVTSSTVSYEGKNGSSGIPILHARVSAFDMRTNAELPYNQRGEIRVDSPAHMLGYYKNPAATDAYFYTDANGVKWGRTGDIGYVDEDGDVFILGRASDSFIAYGGQQVYHFDIEAVLLQDDRISACKALGLEIGGRRAPVAHVQLRERTEDDFSRIVRELDRCCRKQLPDYAVPVAYKQRDSFPVHANGKRDNESLLRERDGYVDCEGKPIDYRALEALAGE